MFTKLNKILFSLLLTLILTSCQKEFSNENGGVSNGGGGFLINCKSCSYFPVCSGNKYTYNDTIMGNLSVRNVVMDVIKDTVIDGKPFNKYTAGDGLFAYYNCTNGESRNIVYNAVGMGGTQADKIDLIMIKAEQPVNATWTDIVKNQADQNVEFRSTIIEKGISRMVLEKNYSDVIHVKTISGIDLPQPIGFFAFTESDYYFAKNIGLIEAIITDINSATILQHTVVKSYMIP